MMNAWMRWIVLASITGSGCGADDDAMPDARTPTGSGHDYDLSCVGMDPTVVPNPIHFGGRLLDMTDASAPFPVPDTEIKTYTVADNTLVGSGTTDASGTYAFDVTTTGVPARVWSEYHGAGLVPARIFVSNAPFVNHSNGSMFTVHPSRLDALATALGTALDPSKGVLEVWTGDCSVQPFPGATIAVTDHPDAKWGMLGGVGVWLPRPTTLNAPEGLSLSVAATVNLTPGVHEVTVTSGNIELGPHAISVAAGSWTVLLVAPGIPRM